MHDVLTTAKTAPAKGTVPAPAAPVPSPRENAPARAATTQAAPRAWSAKAMRWLIIASGLCAAVVAAIGFVGSYDALRGLAEEKSFGAYSFVFPVGIDAGIIAMYGLDLVLVWRRMPKPLLRLIAHILTLATIVFNANAGTRPVREDPLGAAMHGVLPLLFVAVVEAARHLIIRTNKLSLGTESDQVPLHRWILSPWRTWSLYRRMKLWGITSYARMVAMEQQRTVYRAWLQHQHGRAWKKKAGASALLPFTMAPYGLSVEEALALPQEQKEAEDARRAAELQRIADAEEREAQRILDAEEREADAKVRRMAISAKVTTAGHQIAAETTAAEATARAAEATATADAETAAHAAKLAAEAARRQAERSAQAVERAAEREEEAEKTAAEAEAIARAEAANRRAAEDREATAAAAAEAARNEAAALRSRAEAERLEADRAESALRTSEAERHTALLAQAAAQAREEAARHELAAQEAEDAARLSPRERAERRVARMILAAHAALPADQRPVQPDMYIVSLEEVGEALGVARTAAGERRQAAYDLILGGYTG
ncbi:DUF2637 domain-containing protein [Streptomyces sp. NPDC012508]|uniref:DUF2637 domain-containing protein n=1 Tax=Streptomyces sp. NPDC012508 TaxID=3364837 RepID=UPI003686393F